MIRENSALDFNNWKRIYFRPFAETNYDFSLKLRSILADQAVAWFDKEQKALKTFKVCSIFEFYDSQDDRCKSCEEFPSILDLRTTDSG
jgi:hypothetical protein